MKRLLWIVGSLFLSVAVAAQSDTCPPLIYDSIVQTNDVCSATGRNQICYGSTSIDVQIRDDADITFAQPGDLSSLTEVESIETSALDVINEEFGIALMQVQANVPGAIPGQVVTFLLMGDASVTDTASDEQRPMDAFQFRTGIGTPSCEDVNFDTLVVDSPDGLTVTFNVNGIDVELGSTAAFIGMPDNMLDMLVVEGEGTVTANGESVIVEAGNWTQIQMDDSGISAVGAPVEPTPFAPERIAHIPFSLLSTGRNVALGKPVTASNALPTDPPENVVNGLATGGDNWNAGDLAPPQWIEIDLLRPYAVSQIRMLTSQFPEAQFDPTVHSILVRGEGETDYSEVHVFAEETRDDQWLEFSPESPIPNVRYVRIQTTSTIHWVSWGEIEVYSAGFVGCVVSADSSAVNLRSGAGVAFEQTGTLAFGDSAIVQGYSTDSDDVIWWQLAGDNWLRSDLVSTIGSCGRVPQR